MPEVLLHPDSVLSTLALFQNESILACGKAKKKLLSSVRRKQRDTECKLGTFLHRE